MESNVLHQFESDVEHISNIYVLFIAWNTVSGLKIDFGIGIQSYVFNDARNQLVSVCCSMKSIVLTPTDENQKRCIIFPISPIYVLQSK